MPAAATTNTPRGKSRTTTTPASTSAAPSASSAKAATRRTRGPGGTVSSARFGGGDASIDHGLGQRFVVALGLVGVGDGELGDGLVERAPGPQVAAYCHRVARPGVSPGQRPPAQRGIQLERLVAHG